MILIVVKKVCGDYTTIDGGDPSKSYWPAGKLTRTLDGVRDKLLNNFMLRIGELAKQD